MITLPDHMPPQIATLKRNPAGYPIPYFVQRDPADEGNPDFRIMDGAKIAEAVRLRLCWTCGQRLTTKEHTFVAGPMCLVNHTSAEPPNHLACSIWSARACPFLSNPYRERRDVGLEDARSAGGIAITRNPGVTMLAVMKGSKAWKPTRVPNGVIFKFGQPEQVLWFAESREATRSEVMASIASGLPILRKYAEEDGPEAEADLARAVDEVMPWVPA